MTVNQLETNARFVGFLLVRSADARTDKKGGSYLDLTLADKTGDINCKYWDWNQLMDVPKQGSVIKVQGLVQEYNSRKQLRIERMRAALPQDEVDMAQLVACAPEKPEVMRKDIEDTIDTFQSEGLKKIVREMLRLTGDKLEWFPAAQRLHHAERSGLLHHTTSMLNLARHVVAAYPFLNAELLYAGVILHDLCKTTEMISDETGSVSDYSADGLLIGHLVRGVARIEEAAKNVGVSGEIVLLLEHMVLAQRGVAEWGEGGRGQGGRGGQLRAAGGHKQPLEVVSSGGGVQQEGSQRCVEDNALGRQAALQQGVGHVLYVVGHLGDIGGEQAAQQSVPVAVDAVSPQDDRQAVVVVDLTFHRQRPKIVQSVYCHVGHAAPLGKEPRRVVIGLGHLDHDGIVLGMDRGGRFRCGSGRGQVVFLDKLGEFQLHEQVVQLRPVGVAQGVLPGHLPELLPPLSVEGAAGAGQ